MSAVAKKMMEKYGWKEGEGLGKERSGVKSYVKVTRRDPHTATGLGHAADPAQGGSLASTHAIELDAIYGQLRKETSKRHQRSSTARVHGADEGEEGNEGELSDMSTTTTTSSAVRTPECKKLPTAARAGVKRQRRVAPSSPSDSDSDGDDRTDSKRSKSDHVSDVTRMSDKELFQRCGGVCLGRAGRHRFFDGKLKRIHDSS
ncbi:hypothetical protein LSCM4_06927 [Leishmania orientalis]|uniref:G-patch domain-containing protein n=1 Tax=Leishmania orientalis TaxID=2249476 RepID=A0A836KT66_9TRYP|nr:hypothetical protein LSCM4_06927 [Leishmania orientalis]